jgi:hypothetical protein
MEPDLKVRDREPLEAEVVAAVVAEAVVLVQDLMDIVYVRTAEKKSHISLGKHVLI